MTTQQADHPLTVQHQLTARPCARWTQQRRALAPMPLLYSRAEPFLEPMQRLVIAAHSLHSVQVATHIGYRHPTAYRKNIGSRVVRVSDAGHLNFSFFSLNRNSFVIQTLTSGEGGGLDFDKCLHGVSPVEASNIEHVALFRNTVRRKVAKK